MRPEQIEEYLSDDRCDWYSADAYWVWRPRDDGWRCGHPSGHLGSHELFSADGERTLFTISGWEHRGPTGV